MRVKNRKLIIAKAIKFAKKYHKGQKRINGEPYINHPLRVANRYKKLFKDEKGIVGALLHDVLEDGPKNTGKKEEEIKKEMERIFGKEIVEIVEALTVKNKKQYGKRLIEYIEKKKDDTPLKIKICDLYDNLNTLDKLDKKLQQRLIEKYKRLIEKYKDKFRKTHSKEFEKLRTLVEKRAE